MAAGAVRLIPIFPRLYWLEEAGTRDPTPSHAQRERAGANLPEMISLSGLLA